ncbi:diguanylate cyclase [Thermodesulfovibrio hydrogeniphilus]
MKALIIEPGKVTSHFVENLFETYGLTTATANSAKEALSLVEKEHFDIIVIAKVLPDGDGLLLAQKLRKDFNLSIPIVLVTSDVSQELIEKAFSVGITLIVHRSKVQLLENFIRYYFAQTDERVSGAKILLVEDSRQYQKVLQSILITRKYNVDCCRSVSEALSLIENNEYDLYIIDLVLADNESGLYLVHKLREMTDNIVLRPILVLTGYDDLTRRSILYRLGVNDYIIKPPNEIEFLARVYNLITMKKIYMQMLRHERILKTMALKDSLTEIPNRRAYDEISKKYVQLAKRENISLSILVIDIDHFKRVNDELGHSKGDEVLKAVAMEISKSVRISDFVARYGGEEFAVLLMNCVLKDAADVAEKIKKRISQNVSTSLGSITVSIGVSQVNPKDETIEKAFERADKALYQAKQQGRNKVVAIS